MKITPLDIRRKEFKRSVRGYSDEEVDVFLDEVADEFERLFQENMELQDRAQRLDEQIAAHAQVRDALEKTLVSAQIQAEEMRANAHKESELIVRDAQLKARSIVDGSYGETQKLQQSLVQLKRLDEEFRFKFRSLLEGYLNLLSQAPIATTAGTEATTLASAAAALVAEGPAAMVAPMVAPLVAPADAAVPREVLQPPVVEKAPPVLVKPEDEVPTEESEGAVAEVVASAGVSTVAEARQAIIDQVGAASDETGEAVAVKEAGFEDVTAETTSSQPRPVQEQPAGDDSLRGSSSVAS